MSVFNPPTQRSHSREGSNQPSHNPDLDGFWTWQAVEDRLVDAMRHWWRSPDPDARFSLGGRISSAWQNYFPDRRDLALWGVLADQVAAEPRPLPLSRADVERMTEASEWLRFVPEADRRLVVMALARLAAGDKTVPWLRIMRRLGQGHGSEGLRKRYSRALTAICHQLNGAKPAQMSEGRLSSRQTWQPSK